MVGGRRVRTVLTYASNDECCSPHPKRKDINMKYSKNNIIRSNKSQIITQFYQSVDAEIDCTKSIPVNDLSITERTEDVKDFNVDLYSDTKVSDIKSPPTPHRIELCSERIIVDEEQIIPKNMNLCKSRKKIKNDPKSTQQNGNSFRKEGSCENHKLTDYFPIRRSARKTKTTVLEEKQLSLERKLRSGEEEGLEVRVFESKGRGVIASKRFEKGEFVVEYSGELIDVNEAKRREQKYAEDQNTGCYMYYFKHKNQQHCIDATAETGRLGRLVNHSRSGNLLTKSVSVDNQPHLVLIAKDTIQIGEEVTYDYGDRSKTSLQHHPWLAL